MFEASSNEPLQLLSKYNVEYLFLEWHWLVKYGHKYGNQML